MSPTHKVIIIKDKKQWIKTKRTNGIFNGFGLVVAKWVLKQTCHKRSHKHYGIGVGRIRTFSFLPIPSLMTQWKLGCRSWKQKRKNQPITRSRIEHCDWLVLPLLLPILTIQFSVDHKRRNQKRNVCSASDSVGLIFTMLTTDGHVITHVITWSRGTRTVYRWLMIFIY